MPWVYPTFRKPFGWGGVFAAFGCEQIEAVCFSVSKVGFYDSRAWRRVRRQVMEIDHYECQICKAKGILTKKHLLVHHEYHLEEYPQFGLMMWVDDPMTGQRRRNLITVCKCCHETVCHPGRAKRFEAKEPLTPERW